MLSDTDVCEHGSHPAEDTITNCSFGGKDLRTLYVTCGTKIVAIRTEIAGKKAYRPGA